MGLHEQEGQSLEELDAADEQEVARVEGVVLRVVEEARPATISELSVQVRAEAGDVDNSLIRAAILRLLNGNQIHLGNRREVPAAQ
jgi:inactivated superfamily I helicase